MTDSWRLEDKHNERPSTGYWRTTDGTIDSLVQRYDTGSNRNYSNSPKSFTSQLVINLKANDSPSNSRRPSTTTVESGILSVSGTKQRCEKCFKEIDLTKESEIKFGGRFYHDFCFNCARCNKNLRESNRKSHTLTENGEPLCYECEVEEAKRCFNCSKPIVGEKSIIFDENFYHRECFHCSVCERNLSEEKDIYKHESKPCCLPCANENFMPRCAECSKPIGPGKLTVFDTKKFHVDCFRCGQCEKPMTDRQFYTKDGKPCCNQCYTKKFAEFCNKCLKTITDGKTILYESKSYHPDCFCCGQCGRIMTDRKFHTQDGKPCCNQCFERKFAKICAVCSKLIDEGSSTIFNEKIYHSSCFRCGQCSASLSSGTKCYVFESKPCCDRCFTERATPKCSQCFSPILEKYTTYNGKKYHPDCFRCSKCFRVIESHEKFYNDPTGYLCKSCG